MKFLLKLVGLAAGLGGLALVGATLMVDADASIQMLIGLIAMAGLLIAAAGGVIWAIGALLGRGKGAKAAPSLSPEQQQLRDSREFLASRSNDDRDRR